MTQFFSRMTMRSIAILAIATLFISLLPLYAPVFAATIATATVELVPNPAGTDSEGESVSFTYTGPISLPLLGFSFENAGGSSIDFAFPDVSLASGDTFKVCAPLNTDVDCDANWTSGSFTNTGDTLSVFAPGMTDAVFTLSYDSAADNEVISQTVPVLTGAEDIAICEVNDVTDFSADQEPVAGIVSGADIEAGDIVPPFFYFIDLGNFGFFAGQNHDAAGQALLANDCIGAEVEIEKNEETVIVTGDDFVLGEGGWLFNADPRTTTPFEFTDTEASIGTGALFVPPIANDYDSAFGPCTSSTSDQTGCDKFIGANTIQLPVADFESISYDFNVAAVAANDAQEFYLNVYTNIDESDNFYDCRFDFVPEIGTTGSFMTAAFSSEDTPANVTKRGSRIAACPATIAEMPAGSFVHFFAISVGDTLSGDTGVSGYYDNVVLETTAKIITYDFEPADVTKPDVVIVTPENEEIVPATFVVTGTATDTDSEIDRVDYTVTEIDAFGGSFVASVDRGTATGTTDWEFNVVDASTGFYRLKVQAFDTAGNHKFRFHDVFVDADKPMVTFLEPTNGATFEPGIVAANGTAVDEQSSIVEVLYTVNEISGIGGTFVANGTRGVASGTSTWNFSTADLPEGFYRLKVQAFDEDGNFRYKFHDIEVVAAPLVCAPGVNLLANASFEEPEITNNRGWDLVDPIGWMVNRVNGGQSDKIELQAGVFGWLSSDGDQHTELGTNNAVVISQEIPTIAGKEYRLTWDYSPRPGVAASENDIDILVDDAVVASNDGTLPVGQTAWTSHSYDFVGTGETMTVAFKDDGKDNGLGGFIDNAALVCDPGAQVGAYCGDGQVNGSWEQCEIGEEGCTDYCLFANQCSVERLVKVTIEDSVGPSFDGSLYLGSEDNLLPNGVWFSFDEMGDDSFVEIANAVDGLAISRNIETEKLALAFVGGNPSLFDEVSGTVETLGIDLGSIDRKPNPSFPLENSGRGIDVVTKDDNEIYFSMKANTGNDAFTVEIGSSIEKFNCPDCKAGVEARVILQDVPNNIGNEGNGNMAETVVLGSGETVAFGEWFPISEATTEGMSAAFIADERTVTNFANPDELEGLFVSRKGNGEVAVALYAEHDQDEGPSFEYIRAILEFRDAAVDADSLQDIQGQFRFENHSETDAFITNDGTDSARVINDNTAVAFDLWANTGADAFTVEVARETIESCANDTEVEYEMEKDRYLVEGYKFEDVNADGVWSTSTESGLNNWVIALTNGSTTATTTTDETGYYSFSFNESGMWTVSEVQQVGWTQTAPASGSCTEGFGVNEVETTELRCDFGNQLDNEDETPQAINDPIPAPNRTSGGLQVQSGLRQVLGASTSSSTEQCQLYLTEYLRQGIANDSFEVIKLQLFLNWNGYQTPITGRFDSTTDASVRAFQVANSADVLLPWVEAGLATDANPTGYVFLTTKWKINDIVCPGIAEFPELQ